MILIKRKNLSQSVILFLLENTGERLTNRAMKNLMLDHAFKFVETVIFHIGAKNIRSQKAIEKLGAIKVGEIEINYPGEDDD